LDTVLFVKDGIEILKKEEELTHTKLVFLL